MDQVVIFYNYAVVAFWQRQFRKADAIISRTIPFSEPLEESFSRRQSLLYLEVRRLAGSSREFRRTMEDDRIDLCGTVYSAVSTQAVQRGAGQAAVLPNC